MLSGGVGNKEEDVSTIHALPRNLQLTIVHKITHIKTHSIINTQNELLEATLWCFMNVVLFVFS